MRRVQQDQSRPIGDRSAQRVYVQREVGRSQRDRLAHRAGHRDACRVGVVERLEGDDLVTDFEQRQQRRGNAFSGAGDDEHFAIGIELDPVEAALMVGNGAA